MPPNRIHLPNGNKRPAPAFVTTKMWTDFLEFMSERDQAMARAIDDLNKRLDAAGIAPYVSPVLEEPAEPDASMNG